MQRSGMMGMKFDQRQMLWVCDAVFIKFRIPHSLNYLPTPQLKKALGIPESLLLYINLCKKQKIPNNLYCFIT